MSSAGDVNGDGFDDLIIGADGGDPADMSSAGESYVVLGGNFTGGAETQPGTDAADTLNATNGEALDILIGGQSGDTLISDGGPDVLRGGEGNDILAIPDANFDNTRRLVGGNGADTLRLDGSGISLDLTSIADNRIVDIEVLDITGNSPNSLTLDQLEVLNLSSTSNTVTVLRDNDDTVSFGEGWEPVADVVEGPRTFQVFTQGAATLRIEKIAFLDLFKQFDPPTIGPGSVSTLTFDIFNGSGDDGGSGGEGARDLAFTDVLPSGMTIASPARATSECGGIVTAPHGGSSISFSDGMLAAGDQCSITVDVTSSSVGVHTNETNSITSSIGTGNKATADLTVSTDLPGFTKGFDPPAINFGSRSTLTFEIDNSANQSAVGQMRFTDDLPSGMVIADPPNVFTDCASPSFPLTLTAVPGQISVNFSAFGTVFGAPSLAAFSSCTISVDVMGESVGMLGNTTSELMTSTGASGATEISSGKAAAILEVTASEILLTKSFVDDPVPPGATVDVEFTIMNRDRSEPASDITFTDDLDATLTGLEATGLPADGFCGSSSQLTGTGTLTLSGANLGAGGSCTFSATLQVPTGAIDGPYLNTTSNITGEVGGATVTGDPASDTLFVSSAPILAKEFIDDPVGGGGTATVRFTITNTSPAFDATNIAFTDEFPDIIPSDSQLPADGFCGTGSTASFLDQTNPQPPSSSTPATLDISGGMLEPSQSCSFDVSVNVAAGAAGGVYPNTTSEIAATINNATVTGDPATDDLVVVEAPKLTKQFTNNPVLADGTATLEFAINYGDEGTEGNATAIAFTDDLDAALTGLVATGLPLNDVCGSGSQLTGTDTISLTGGTLSPEGSCTFSVNVAVPEDASPGSYTNTTSDITATVLGVATTGNAAQDDLKVAGLSFTKAFTDDPVIAGDEVTLEFTIANLTPDLTATNITFRDDLDQSVADLAATNLPLNNICGDGSSLTALFGDEKHLVLADGTLAPGTSCTFNVTLAVPAGTADDTYGNVTSGATATMNGTTVVFDPASDALEVNSTLLSLAKEFGDDRAEPSDAPTLTFTLDNLDPARAASAIAFTDDLGAALDGLTFDGVNSDDCGGTIGGVGTTMIDVSGASLAAGGSCTIELGLSVPGDAPVATVVTNTTSELSGMIDSLSVRGDAASDTLDIVQQELDFGDVPDSTTHPTLLANDGARHVLGSGLFLGSGVDAEEDGQPNATATGDDVVDRADEDGIDLPARLGTGQTVMVDVTASGAGRLNAWIDLDNNGDWDGTGEQFLTDRAISDVVTPISITIPTSAKVTDRTYVRFRFDSDGGLSYDGLAADGEVEDYAVEIFDATPPELTAPADLMSVEGNATGGATVGHTDILAFLAAFSVSDLVDPNPSVTNNAPALFPVGQTTTVTFTATDNSGNTATASADVTVVDTTAPTVTAPANITVEGDTTGGANASNSVIGVFLRAASASDVVDDSPSLTQDAPNLFPLGTRTVTFTATDDSGNTGTATATVTVEDTTAPSVTAPADITVTANVAGGAEATLSAIAAFLGGASASDRVDATPAITDNAPSILPVGANTITFTATDDAGNFATAAGTITVNPPVLDYGDAPAGYPVTFAQDGARHTVGELFLGQSVDTEANGQPSNAADGDDSNADDEDGVTPIATIVATSTSDTTSSFAIVASAAALAGGNGKLDAWIDFDQNGDWFGTREQIATSVDLAAGLNIVSFTVPAGATPGDTAARFRISPGGGLAPTGAAPDGEVEDYIFTLVNGDSTGEAAVEVVAPVAGTIEVVAGNGTVIVRTRNPDNAIFIGPGGVVSTLNIIGTAGDDTLGLEEIPSVEVSGDAGGGNDTLRLLRRGFAIDFNLTTIPDNAVQGIETIVLPETGNGTLTLDAAEVVNISSTTNTLRVKSDPDDTVAIGTGWAFAGTAVDNGDFIRILTQGDATLQLDGPLDWSYPENPLDSTGSGSIEPRDVLVIINEINDPQFSSPDGTLVDAASLTEFPGFFYDVAPDGFVVPRDALIVINFLNGAASPEGEDPVVGLPLPSRTVVASPVPRARETALATPGAIATTDPWLPAQVATIDYLPARRALAMDHLAATDNLFADVDELL